MTVPPRPGSDVHPTFESDFGDEPSPRAPKPLPDRARSRTTAAAVVALVGIAVALVVLL
jgi:hypothetical protein